MRFALAVFISCAAASGLAAEDLLVPDFSAYAQTAAFKSFVEEQTNAARHVGTIMAMTEFTNSGSVAQKYRVSLGRWVSDYTDRWSPPRHDVAAPSITVGSGSALRLTEMQLQTLVSAIPELPLTNAFPPIDELVIVSFHRGTNWTTHSYDKRRLPKPLGQIYDMRPSRWPRSFTVQ
jgi:hypothetical protein